MDVTRLNAARHCLAVTPATNWTTYTRASYTGLDYADQRYYASTYGRFNTADQYQAAANDVSNPQDPTSWNRYAYVGGDPINRVDASGQDWCDFDNDLGEECLVSGVPEINTQVLQQLASIGDLAAIIVANIAQAFAQQQAACPLVSVTGDYTDAKGVAALFAPDIATDIDAAFSVLNQEGIVRMITSGFRTAASQGGVQGSPNGAAPVGMSWHQVGEAIDINRRVPSTTFQAILTAMTDEGLTWDGTFSHNDPVHFRNAPAGAFPNPTQIAACAAEHP